MSNQQEKIRLKIPTARSKLQTSFPQDPRGDIKIIVGKKVFKLQKAFLRLQSSYFKRILNADTTLLNIDQNFQDIYFQNVLKCFYGITSEIKRNEVLNYYPIIKFLQIECLLKYLRQDMVKNISSYDLFLLMRLAHQYSEQDIFEACLNQLQKENFEQLNYSKFELLKSSEELFKLIIKTHNRSKNQGNKGLSYIEIDQLIRQFCQQKNYTENQYHEMKFELIDKQALTSVEYKQIFLDQAKNIKKSFIGSNSFVKSQSNGFMFGTQGGLSSMVKPTNLTESMISPTSVKTPMMSNQLTLQMQNTFQKKLNQQLKQQNQSLKKQLQNLKQLSEENLKKNQDLKKILTFLEEAMKQKDDEDKKQKDLMCRMEKTINILRSQLDDKGQMIKKLQEKVAKLQKNSNKKYVVDSDQEEQQRTIQSQIVPAHLIGQMLPGQTPPRQQQPVASFKKKPPPSIEPSQQVKRVSQPQPQQEQQIDDEDLEQMYMPRLAFVQQPLGTPKKYLPVLADLITQEGWNKKKLTPIYRRSVEHSQLGKAQDIRGKNELLFLIKTQYGQYIGGYITVQLPKNVSGQYIEDRGAFLFSLSKKQKFIIQKQQASQAICLTDSQLIIFGNDLSIALQCTKQRSQCNWPSSYHSDANISHSDYLIGGQSPFYIKQIEVYSAEEAEMEMVL